MGIDLRKILSPLGPVFNGAVSVRNFGYDRGILKSKKLPVPVFSVGNVSVGGSGKTPFTMFLVEKLLSIGKRPAVLSRGYRRAGSGLAISCPGAGREEDVRNLGDEPALISERYPDVPVAVHKDRYMSGLALVKKFGTEVFVLDDGFQNRELARDLDFVLLRESLSELGDKFLPGGNLRDSKSRLRDADIIVLTSHSAFGLHDVDFRILREWTDAPVVAASFLPGSLVDAAGDTRPLESEKRREVLAFCGVANPRPFFEGLAEQGFSVKRVRIFPDHHWYDEYDLDEIFGGDDEITALTTEKDAARIFLDEELRESDEAKRILAVRERAVVNFGEEHLDRVIAGVLGEVYA